ncbi:hypothetical protein ASPACDRAFT_60044 [Aspergillus aculeatus ATCC 16872]|uniref:CENP-V/GFA domain-containing protein n=1 Tax=Aspergillus aculeatus (strain ATCC 16872 / CBS 172.66 / WB 5094) TaxID=690307 RepID=A0A1L9WVM9_ASPA1|nr:uncharacterized protein ASPACDRAFT_60044 [Aspergillus aculeatus ATCC 16872]OJK00194.1 hypothetical protein ASPACDRAFT_60044 [Aspergillus aculeatus ATCC 16872]
MTRSEPTIYPGNCHCGTVRFEIHLSGPFQTTFACPCRLCAKTGCPWIFAQDDELKFTRGRDTLARYKTQKGEHEFCATCGTQITVRNHLIVSGQAGLGVSVRLPTLSPAKCQYGTGIARRESVPSLRDHLERRLPPAREEPRPSSVTESQPTTDQDLKTYRGGCHCGATQITVTSPPLRHVQVKEDNCSICQRAAVTIEDPRHQLREYRFGRQFTGHRFCGVCGVQLYMHLHGPPAAVVARLSREKQELVRRNLDVVPVRVAVLEGVEWEEIRVEREDEGTEGPIAAVRCARDHLIIASLSVRSVEHA